MKIKQIKNSLLLVLTAFIWGVAFVAQSEGADALGPYTMNCIRFFIGGAFLLPVIKVLDKFEIGRGKPNTPADRTNLIKGGVLSGLCLFFASTIQQLGIYYGHSTAKAGFITACYILLVPILGLFINRKCGLNIWIGVVLALIGLYFICGVGRGEGIEAADGMLLACALLFSMQILVIDRYAPLVDGVRMSCIQFFVTGALGLIPMIIFEVGFSGDSFSLWCDMFTSLAPWIALLYCGILSSGVAYTLQIVAQDGLNPTVASLIMSLESVFAALAGAVILHERLSFSELLGCGLIFGAIILAQIDFDSIIQRK